MNISGLPNYRKSNRLKSRKSLYSEHAYPKSDIFEDIFNTYKLIGNETILDIGCGFGDLLIRLRKEGHKGKLYGVDISNGMIKEAKGNSKRLDIDFRTSKAENLPFEKESFDIIICKHSLYHFDLTKATEELERCVKKNGKLILTLNSYTRKSRFYSEKYKLLISKILNNFDFVDIKNRINLETYHKFFKKFLILKEVRVYKYITLEESTPYVEYMSTIREYWDPIPSAKEWDNVLDIIRADIDIIIKEKGCFQENICFGIMILEKL